MKFLLSLLLVFLSFSLFAKNTSLTLWNEPYKSMLEKYVKDITNKKSPNYVPIEDRIAAFDLDGSLIAEEPHTFEELLTNIRLMEKLEKDKSLLKNPIYKAVYTKDNRFFGDLNNVLKKISEAFAGETLDFYKEYLKNAYNNMKNVKFSKPYKELVYAPMVEFIDYLKANGFKVYICSGTQEELIKLIAPDLHIDLDKAIGTVIAYEYVEENGKSVLKMLNNIFEPSANVEFKPVRIHERVGKRPIVALANSFKDRQMLQYTADSNYKNIVMVLNHDDPREVINTHREDILKHAKEKNWIIVSMKDAFKKVF